MAADLDFDPLVAADEAELAGYVDCGIWELEQWLMTLANDQVPKDKD